MRVLDLWSGVSSWRWTPTVGLATGAVIYAATAILLVPDHIGSEPARSALDSGRAPHTGNALTTTAAVVSEAAADTDTDTDSPAARRAARRRERLEATQAKRGFSPPLPRPEAPAPPPPEPAAPPPPPLEPAPAPPAPAPVNPPSSTQRVDVSPNVPAAEPPATPAPAENANAAQAGNVAPAAEAGGAASAPPAQ